MEKITEKAKNKLTDIFQGAIKRVSPMVKKEVSNVTDKAKSNVISSVSSLVKVGVILWFTASSLKPAMGVPTTSGLGNIPNGFFIIYNETTNNYYSKGGTLDGNGN